MSKPCSIKLLLCILFAFYACSSPDVRNTAQQEEAEADTDTLAYSYQFVSRQSKHCADSTIATCAQVYLKYPVLNDSSGHNQRIHHSLQAELTRAFMEEERFADPQAVADGFIKTYKIILKQNEGYAIPWKLERIARVYANTDTLFGVRFEEYLQTGQGQPNTVLRYLNYNPLTGQEWTVEAITEAAVQERWRQEAEAQFRQQQHLPAGVSLKEAGYWFPEDEFSLPNNFHLAQDSIIFFFNPSEVAQHAEGRIRLAIRR